MSRPDPPEPLVAVAALLTEGDRWRDLASDPGDLSPPERDAFARLAVDLDAIAYRLRDARELADPTLWRVSDGPRAWRCKSCSWAALGWRGPWIRPCVAECPTCGGEATRRNRQIPP